MASSSSALALRPPPLPALPAHLGEPPGSNSGALALSKSNGTAHALVAASPQQAIGIQTSGRELKLLLERTGYEDQRLDGAEKLDLLVWMADQVKLNIGKRRKMKLALRELNDFLKREGMAPKSEDAKSTISTLLELRRRELARLDYSRFSDQETEDERFNLALVEMPAQDVSDCFALVPYTDAVEVHRGSRGCSMM